VRDQRDIFAADPAGSRGPESAGEPGAEAGEAGAEAGETGSEAGETGSEAGETGADAGDDRRILTVAELNRTIEAAVRAAFPVPVWVRGEVQGLRPGFARRKHVYFELHDTGGSGAADFQIPAAILDWDRRRFGLDRYLDGSDPDFVLRNELEVCLQCRVDFYPPFGKLSLKVIGLDPAYSLGKLEALRREVLAFLQREELTERNATVPLPVLPLRVGLITAAGSAAERDFRTGLEAAPYPFAVDLVDCRMQGEQTQRQVVQALEVLAGRGVDIVVITRGGGSRADLSWFDQKELAVAIATCPRPVLTAIGHEVDRSIADVVAHTSCKTPTAAAEFLVERLAVQDERVARLADRLDRVASRRLEETHRRMRDLGRLAPAAVRPAIAAHARLRELGHGLEGRVLRRVGTARESLSASEQGLRGAARARTTGADSRLQRAAIRLAPRRLLAVSRRAATQLTDRARILTRRTRRLLESRGRRLEHLEKQARLQDPRRLLARGFTLTRDAAGRPVRRAAELTTGDAIVTEFQDGEVGSIVQEGSGSGRRDAGAGRSGSKNEGGQSSRPNKGDKRGKGEAKGGQETLFR